MGNVMRTHGSNRMIKLSKKKLIDTITKMYQQMDAERTASIERAKAGSVGSINVSSEKR